jgi:hypothetical protein
MPETPKDESFLEMLVAQREKIRQRIAVLEADLATCENAIAEARQNADGKRVAKGRIISLVKDYVLEHGPSTYAELLEYVTNHGGVSVAGDIEKRLNQSLSRCVTANTMQQSGDKYDLTDRERNRLKAEEA